MMRLPVKTHVYKDFTVDDHVRHARIFGRRAHHLRSLREDDDAASHAKAARAHISHARVKRALTG